MRTQRKISSQAYKKLLNLTMPNEDFAIMAGDLAISTEILELVAGFIAARKNEDKAHSLDEVEVRLVRRFLNKNFCSL